MCPFGRSSVIRVMMIIDGFQQVKYFRVVRSFNVPVGVWYYGSLRVIQVHASHAVVAGLFAVRETVVLS